MAGFPFVMQSALFAASTNVDAIYVPEERVFRNTTPHWLKIMRIGLQRNGAANPKRTVTLDNPGTSSPRPQWAIRFGHTEVTNGFVPFAATTWRPNVDEPAAFVEFAQPVYLAPNDRLDVKFKYLATLDANLDSGILAALVVPVDRPDAIRVPALFGWEGTSRGGNSGLFSEDVPVGTLYNEFEEVMHVERIIGRLGLLGGDPSAGAGNVERAYPAAAQILVDLALQDGAKITRDPTPLAALFDLARQSWLTNFVLPSKGYIQANVSGNLTDSAQAPKTYYPYLGMLGYRTIG